MVVLGLFGANELTVVINVLILYNTKVCLKKKLKNMLFLEAICCMETKGVGVNQGIGHAASIFQHGLRLMPLIQGQAFLFLPCPSF